MPRAKKKPIDQDEAMEENGYKPERQKEELADLEDKEVESLIRGNPSGARCISVYKVPSKAGGRPIFIGELAPEYYTAAYIQRTYGGGIYFSRWKKKDGTLLRSEPIEVSGPSIDLNRQDEEDGGEEEPMRETQQAQQLQHHQPEERPAYGGISPLDLMKMIQDAEDKGEKRMLRMMELMRPPAQSPDVTKQVFDIVEKIVPMMGQGGDGGNPWLMVLNHFKEPLSKLVDTIHTVATRSMPSVPSSGAAGRPIPQAPAQTNVNPPSEEDMIGLLIRQYLPILVNAAAKNADPEGYADLVLDQVPESQYDSLKNWLARPDCLETLCTFEPGIRYQQDWWITLRNTLLGTLSNGHSDIQPNSTPEQSQQD